MRNIIFFMLVTLFSCYGTYTQGTILMPKTTPIKLGKKANLPTIAIITTGGTIAQKKDTTGAAIPSVSGTLLVAAVPELLNKANVEIYTLCNEDSSRIHPNTWLELTKLVKELTDRKDISGVVITHGSDTMAEGAFFVHICTSTIKPVVFTGAMRDASAVSSDGAGNIKNAVQLAISSIPKEWGVTVCLNQYISDAMHVIKTHTNNVDSFDCGDYGYLGYLYENNLFTFQKPFANICLPIPERLTKKVEIFMNYPGCDGKAIERAVKAGVDGIVVEGVGSGNVNRDVYKAMLAAKEKDIPVVVTSSIPRGPVLPVYGGDGGGSTLNKKGFIISKTLRARKACLLLRVCLEHDMNKKEIAKLFQL